MEMREFGGTGIRASVVGLGCNNFGIYQNAAQAVAVVRKALDVGINFLDMAGEHGSGLEESLVAEALGPRRKEVIIATKFGQAELLGLKDGNIVFSEDKTRQGASRRWIMQAVEESLTRLKTDYIDLYQVHVADPETPREETLRALDDLVRQGKVRALGEAATFATADDLNTSQAIAAANGLTPFATMEANYSILVRDAEKAIITRAARSQDAFAALFPARQRPAEREISRWRNSDGLALGPDAVHEGFPAAKSGGHRSLAGYRRRARDQAGAAGYRLACRKSDCR